MITMIEVIYKEEKKKEQGNEDMLSVPRNIRQIGLINDSCKIYVEDYVYTFLGKVAARTKQSAERKGSLAVLLGEGKWAGGTNYIFIRGALEAEGAEAAAEHIGFTDEIWTQIHQEQEKYFPDQEIVGWFFAQPELQLEVTESIKKVHLKHFGGGEKVLMLMDPTEREDAFFRFENGFLVRQPGFYLYYEKNPMMQTYMIEKNHVSQETETEKVEDDAVKNFRRIIKKKKNEEKEEKESGVSIFSYAATACLAFAVLAVGINFYQNYREIQNVNQQAEMAASVISEKQSAEENSEKNGGLEESEPSGEGEKLTVAYPTVTPKIQNTNTPTPEPVLETQNDDGQEVNMETSDTEKEDDSDTSIFYREESDTRKARQREVLAEQQEEIDETATEAIHASYVIQPGDTLYKISMEKYGNMEAIAEICELNSIEENEIIYPGQIIVLP